MKEEKGKIKCLECGKSFGNLGMHLTVHNLDSKSYHIKHPGAPITSEKYIQTHKEHARIRYQSKEFRKKVGRHTFDFLKNKDLKSLLQRDYRSAKVCLNKELWKPSIILYASIIESILIEMTNEKSFENSLKKALTNKIISEKDYYKINLVRDLRNFVHIHKELKEGSEINDYWAKTFADICESIIKRFNKK